MRSISLLKCRKIVGVIVTAALDFGRAARRRRRASAYPASNRHPRRRRSATGGAGGVSARMLRINRLVTVLAKPVCVANATPRAHAKPARRRYFQSLPASPLQLRTRSRSRQGNARFLHMSTMLPPSFAKCFRGRGLSRTRIANRMRSIPAGCPGSAPQPAISVWFCAPRVQIRYSQAVCLLRIVLARLLR